MQRVPLAILNNIQLPASIPGSAQFTTPGTVPSGGAQSPSYATISAFTLNNTTANPRTVTVHVVPPGQSPGAANQIGTAISVPAAGSTPTIVSGLIGHTLPTGWMLYIFADAATAVTVLASGYLTTL